MTAKHSQENNSEAELNHKEDLNNGKNWTLSERDARAQIFNEIMSICQSFELNNVVLNEKPNAELRILSWNFVFFKVSFSQSLQKIAVF